MLHKKKTARLFSVILIFAVLSALLLPSCVMNKKTISTAEFTAFVETSGMTVMDSTFQFTDYPHIIKALAARNQTEDVSFEFFLIFDNDWAKDIFFTNQNKIAENKTDLSVSTSVGMGNYDRYTLTADKYYVVSRIENTVLYVEASLDKKDSVDKILKTMGY